MLDNTQSIICAFGLAAAAPRSPYRHLELCGIALETGFQIGFHIKGLGRGITAQVQRVMGVTLFAAAAQRDPRNAFLVGERHHIAHQALSLIHI